MPAPLLRFWSPCDDIARMDAPESCARAGRPGPRDRAARAARAAARGRAGGGARWSTSGASPRTRRACRIRTRSRTPRLSSPPQYRADGEMAFLVTAGDGTLHRRLRRRQAATARIPRSAIGSASILGQGLCHRGGARGDRLCVRRTRLRDARRRRAGQQSRLAPRPGEMRLRMDRRRVYRMRALGSSVPFDRFRLERAEWQALQREKNLEAGCVGTIRKWAPAFRQDHATC